MTKQIEQFIALRKALVQEKATIEARLAKINAVLGTADSLPALPTVPAPVTKVPKAKPAPKRKQVRVKNKLSVKAAILQVTQAKPLTREEILEGVKKLGYKFTTDKPLNSMGVVLYNKKIMKNVDGKFSPVK